jgi:anaerobic ribonucleoside-triphosphate reductase activating protein
MLIRIAGITQDSIVDGPGLRLAVFTQGCPHHCEGCHNPETHDFAGGWLIDTGEIIAMMDKNPLLEGITLTGGEPFCQSEACIELARAAKKRGLNVWVYTGHTFRQLQQLGWRWRVRGLLRFTDVLVDGPFIQRLRTLDAPWRGSKNQRLIDVQRSIAEGRRVELEV